MIIYNVTVKIDKSVQEEWLNWMQTKHIPDVMNTGLFLEYKLSRILLDDPDGVSYSIQYLCANEDNLNTYQNKHANALQIEHTERYRDKFVAFRTLMHVVDHKTHG